MMILGNIFFDIGVMALLGLSLGIIIALAAKFFSVEQDPRVAETEDLLAGINCGACGYAGCADFARALVEGEAQPDQCPVTDRENLRAIAELLGQSFSASAPLTALVHCNGDATNSYFMASYNGINDCRSAQVVAGGVKACAYGCLGLGTCAQACPFDAIEITDQNLAKVHPDICTACGKCVEACPRDLIKLRPIDAPIHNFCSNPEKGRLSKRVCAVSCIGCRKCVKEAGEEHIHMAGVLAVVNYDNPPSAEVAKVCPTGSLKPTMGPAMTTPEYKEETPELVKPSET